MDDLIDVREEVTLTGSIKEKTYWPLSPQAKRAAHFLFDRSWLYPCEVDGLMRMGFQVVITTPVTAP